MELWSTFAYARAHSFKSLPLIILTKESSIGLIGDDALSDNFKDAVDGLVIRHGDTWHAPILQKLNPLVRIFVQYSVGPRRHPLLSTCIIVMCPNVEFVGRCKLYFTFFERRYYLVLLQRCLDLLCQIVRVPC